MILLLRPEGLRGVSDHLRLINQMGTKASLNPAPLLEEMSFDEDIREKDKDCTDEVFVSIWRPNCFYLFL